MRGQSLVMGIALSALCTTACGSKPKPRASGAPVDETPVVAADVMREALLEVGTALSPRPNLVEFPYAGSPRAVATLTYAPNADHALTVNQLGFGFRDCVKPASGALSVEWLVGDEAPGKGRVLAMQDTVLVRGGERYRVVAILPNEAGCADGWLKVGFAALQDEGELNPNASSDPLEIQ